MSPPLDIHLHAEHNIVVACGSVLIQVRNGPMTASILDRIEQTMRLFRARQTKAMGAIVVLEPDAPPVASAIRERQREAIRMLMSSDRVFMSTVLLGSGVIFSLQRTITRGLAKISSKIYVASSVEEAVRWMIKALPGIGVDEHELRAAVEEARITLRERDPPTPLSTRAFIA